ncbi:MAG TPA: RluA family pseudouridine synthase, partial [bacterium]|nr:RluA family pseudouridine synthase [bacterium]
MKAIEIEHRVAPREAGRADRLVYHLARLSHAQVRGLFDHGCVSVNGASCADAGALLVAGDRVRVAYDPARRYRSKPRPHLERAFRLVHEDAHLLVVDKAAGVLTVPTEAREPDALVYALARYLGRGQRVTRRVAIVHRLDRDTSGLLVFGKRQEVAQALKQQFRDRKPERAYLALVAGTLPRPQGTFRGYLATDAALNQYTTPHAAQGKLAVTHYRTLRALPGATLVQVWLETGRRNQIRVQFAESGHPVLGDVRYRPELARHPRWKARRLALHATVLGFRHPETGEALRFEAPPPEEFLRFLGEDSATSAAVAGAAPPEPPELAGAIAAEPDVTRRPRPERRQGSAPAAGQPSGLR